MARPQLHRVDADDPAYSYDESRRLRDDEKELAWAKGIHDYKNLICDVTGGVEFMISRLEKVMKGRGYFDTDFLWEVFEHYRLAESLMELSEQMQENYNQIVEVMKEGEGDEELITPSMKSAKSMMRWTGIY